MGEDNLSSVSTKKGTANRGIERNRVWTKSILGILSAAVGALIMFYLLPDSHVSPDGLSTAGRSLAAVFTAALVLWATEALPIAITSLLVLILIPILGIYKDLKSAAVGFTSPVVYFVIASFILSIAVEKSGLGRRFALWLITRFGTNSRTAVLVFMIGCAALSTIMSDLPTCAIWMSLALPILDKLEIKPGASNLGKALMMGIPIAALIGGVATPVGSSINILALSLLKEKAGIDVSFLQWMVIGIPMAVVMTVAAWWILLKIVPPEVESIGDIDAFRRNQKELGTIRAVEKKTVCIVLIAFVLWIMSSWIKQLDITIVTILAAIAMFLPGVNLLRWNEVEKNTGWSTIIMIGTITSLGLASVDTGLSKWVVDNTLSSMAGWNTVWIIFTLAVFTVLVHLPIPINPAICVAIIPPIITLAENTGTNAAIYALPVVFTASCAFLLPLDAVTLVTYSKGYYSMLDLFVPGLLISMVWIIIMTALTALIGPAVGLL